MLYLQCNISHSQWCNPENSLARSIQRLSAADDIIRIYKELKIGKIAGTNSGGGAAVLHAPSYFELPKSHILFELVFDMAYNSDGTINEISGTKPDIELETSAHPTSFPYDYSKEGLLNDSWISKLKNDF